MEKKANLLSYAVIFTPADEGGYTATVPALPGCVSEGDSFEQAKRNIAEAMSLYLEVVKIDSRASDRSDFIVAPVKVAV